MKIYKFNESNHLPDEHYYCMDCGTHYMLNSFGKVLLKVTMY